MQFVVSIETVLAGKSVAVHRVATIERKGVFDPAELGLTLQDGKAILNVGAWFKVGVARPPLS